MKKQGMYFKMIMASLARRRSRMLVALLAIVVGATVLSGLVTIYYDIPRQMGMQFRSYGANLILVPGDNETSISQGSIDGAVDIIGRERIVGMAAYHYESMTINSSPVLVAGTDLASVRATSPYWYVDGAWPEGDDELLVGKEEAEFFSLAPGDKVTLSYTPEDVDSSHQDAKGGTGAEVEREFTVTGVLDTGGNEEGYFFMSSADIERIVGSASEYDVAEFSIQASSEELSGYADTIAADIPAVTPQLVKRVTESETTVLNKLQALVFLVTAIVLALTMICVATTMTAQVTERRREIGLRMALGASDCSIMFEFMGEGLLLGAIGGLLGAGLGFGFAQVVSQNVFNSSITFRPLLLPVTLVVALAVTALACILPVRNATKVDPALVLKGE